MTSRANAAKNQQQLAESRQQLSENNNDNPSRQINSASTGHRSPKRRRTDIQDDPSLVSPDTDSLTSKSHVPVSPDPVDNSSSSAADFAFTFDQQLAFFTNNPQYLSHPEFPIDTHNHHHPPPVLWEPTTPTLPTTFLPDGAVVVPSYHHHHHQVAPEGDALQEPVPLSSAGEGCAPEHSISSDKRASRPQRTAKQRPGSRPRPRIGPRPRQITLRHDADLSPLQQPEAPPVYWMAQLSDINARLLDLASALPSPQDGPFIGRPVDERFRSQGFPIEDMFKLTRRVADILEKPPPGNETNKMRHSAIDGGDPGNAMFILSTYVRLLDMYQRVFNLVHTELVSQPDSNTTFSFWKLPDVTVGSFAVESSPFLQMSLTIQLAEEFLSRLRGSTARWSGAGAASAMFSGVVDVSFQAFRDREEALAKHLVELRSEMEPLIDS
ncbi:transcription factor [Fusarium longipes]|uniref:Transcription factor n=1 Tax=Fusarium longipes TaxID=694270 RepID=A0A395T332_9HYPO|nr:transcription factor [Fusarium longipes]